MTNPITSTPAAPIAQESSDSADAFTLFLSMYDAEIQQDGFVQKLIAAGQYALARDYVKDLHIKRTGSASTPTPRNPRIDWLALGESFDPHRQALADLKIGTQSDDAKFALRAVYEAGEGNERKDRAFTKSLIKSGHDRSLVIAAMINNRQTAGAYATANAAAECISPLLNDDTLPVIVAAVKARDEYQQVTRDAERAYQAAINGLAPKVRLMASAVNTTPHTLLLHVAVNNGMVVPQSIANLDGWKDSRNAMAVRLKSGVYPVKCVADLIGGMLRDSGVTLPIGPTLIAGHSVTVTKEGIVWPAALRQEGFHFLSHDSAGNPVGGFRIVSGAYRGGDIMEAAIQGNGTVFIELAKDTNKVIADLINPVLAAHGVAFYARQGGRITTAGDSTLIKAIESLVR